MEYNSQKLIKSMVDKIESTEFNKNVFEKTGLFVVKNALPEDLVKDWKAEWDNFYKEKLANGRNVDVQNPVALKENLPGKLASIYKNDILLDFAEKVFEKNVALFNYRFVIKDKFSRGEVFLHHDSCYHIGFLNKASFFVPISYSGKKNGGLTFYLGTHSYGYLGDAGEINPDQFKEQWTQVTPELEPGDFVIMNSLLWHKSGINKAGIDRIVVDITYQPTNDPSGKELLRGEWQTDVFIQLENQMNYFKNSRVKKIIALFEKLK